MAASQKENVNLVKGKGKAPAVSSKPRNYSEPNIPHKTATHAPAPTPSTSTRGVMPASFNAETISILREMHNNQSKTNEKVEQHAN